MIFLARNNNVSVLLSTWAYNPNFGDYASTAHYIYGFVQHNEIIKRIGKDLNISIYDFESEMPKNNLFWSDGRHVNELGSHYKGELFAKYIYNSDLIK